MPNASGRYGVVQSRKVKFEFTQIVNILIFKIKIYFFVLEYL